MKEVCYTNGVIAVKERSLLGEKLLRFPEMTAEEVLRALRESGFGGGGEDAEALVLNEERALDAFIQAYAPSKTELHYLLAPRDFHNAKAAVKAELLHLDPAPMLCPDGTLAAEDILSCVRERNFTPLGKLLGEAAQEALSKEEITGVEVGILFEKALYAHLREVCRGNRLLKKLLAGRADRVNILTAMRAAGKESAEALYVTGGTLPAKKLAGIFEDGADPLAGTPYAAFYALCRRAKDERRPYTEAERELASFEGAYFYERRFELEREQPFLYYVFRRRAEIENVRIILVCLGAGVNARDIAKRLR